MVKWYDAGAGRGFLRRDDGPDVEVRDEWLAAPGALVEGQTVEFELLKAPGGFHSREVRVLAPSPDDPFSGRSGPNPLRRADRDPTTG